MACETIRIQDGYSSCAGVCSDGWYVGALVIDDIDEAFISRRGTDYEQAKENCQNWQEAAARIGRRVTLVQERGDAPLELALADLICGPVCPKEESKMPILAWTQRVAGMWTLKCYFEDQTHTILQSRSVMRNPQVAKPKDGLVLAFERDTDSNQGEVVLLNSNGTELFRTTGRNPRMVASSRGIVLMTEQCSRNSIILLLQEIVDRSEVRRIEIDGGDDYTFNGDLACSPYSDAVVVVAENCPAFGMDCRVGMHRDLKVWRWEDTGALEDISGMDGRMPIERRAFNYWSTENMAPIRPIIFFDEGEPVVAFRQFRHFAFKTFGWDVCICRWGDSGWEKPARVSENLTTPDTGCGIVSVGGHYVSAFPCLDNPGTHTRCSNHRVEITEFAKDHALPPIEVPEDKQDTYFIVTGYKDIAAPPPPLDEPCKERILIWGDLHQHTDYSKCVSAMDGWPGEMFRYARDVLGCRVFTFMDHSPTMSGPENTWTGDQLEILTGDYGIPLFGSEPGTNPGRHTNWYSYDRKIYDRLRCILDSHGRDRQKMYRQVMEDLPLDTVLALRHFHGNMMDDDEAGAVPCGYGKIE